MFINFTNHPSSGWSEEQLKAAEVYGDIIDIDFPAVQADADSISISSLADRYCRLISAASPSAVLVQGEMSLAFAVVSRLKAAGIAALCACSKRDCVTSIADDGSVVRSSIFRFVRFRDYSV